VHGADIGHSGAELWAGRPFWTTVLAVSPVTRPGAHGPGCALGWQVAQDTVRVRLLWMRGVMDRCRQPV
jgi:hypothetical protein